LIRLGVLTCSTSRAQESQPQDESGSLVQEFCEKWWKTKTVFYHVVPDDRKIISKTLTSWCRKKLDLLITTGGTGFSPTDVTPEATRDVLEREAPGLAERMRISGGRKTPLSYLSRGVAGLRGQTLIINLPGSPRAVLESLTALKTILPHALGIMTGDGHGQRILF
jgi:molybdenum cofactor synthesis domain-containing protein